MAPDAYARGLAVERQHLVVLGGWAGANLAGASLGLALADTPAARTFHGTNAAWNVVNLGIAVAGGVGVAQRTRAGPPDLATLERQHRGLQTALAVNLGLDAVYIGTGAVMWGAGGDVRGLDVASMGRSLVLQGAFLVVFDAVFLARHRAVTRRD